MDITQHIQEHIPLAALTTLGLGGKARYLIECQTLEQIRHSLLWAAERSMKVQVLGGGSNAIFADDGYAGLVLKIGLSGVEFVDGLATVAAGENWDSFVLHTVQRGLSGVECLAGIPGLVGATPIQNVGAYGQEVKETIVEVCALDRQSLDEVFFTRSECDFDYRQSRFKSTDRDRYIITQVRYQLRADDQTQIRYPELARYVQEHAAPSISGPLALQAVREAVLHLRASKSMCIDPKDPNSRSAGSFFINPVVTQERAQRLRQEHADMPSFSAPNGVKIPAGWLVESAGFKKGMRHGGVGISQKHALALINYNGSTHELLELAMQIGQGVERKFGIRLQREPVLVE